MFEGFERKIIQVAGIGIETRAKRGLVTDAAL